MLCHARHHHLLWHLQSHLQHNHLSAHCVLLGQKHQRWSLLQPHGVLVRMGRCQHRNGHRHLHTSDSEDIVAAATKETEDSPDGCVRYWRIVSIISPTSTLKQEIMSNQFRYQRMYNIHPPPPLPLHPLPITRFHMVQRPTRNLDFRRSKRRNNLRVPPPPPAPPRPSRPQHFQVPESLSPALSPLLPLSPNPPQEKRLLEHQRTQSYSDPCEWRTDTYDWGGVYGEESADGEAEDGEEDRG